MEMGGKTEQKTGNDGYPSLHYTAFMAISCILFIRPALYNLIFKKKHIFNLITLALVTYLLPFRSVVTGEMMYFSFVNLAEGLILLFFFLCFLFITGTRRADTFLPLLRILLAMELTAIVAPLSYFCSGIALQVFMGVFVAWYLSVCIFAFSHLNGLSYYRSSLSVLLSFFLTQLIPSLFTF